MTQDEWDEECRRIGADPEEHPEETAILRRRTTS
jgi:hypothetical protein